MENELLDFIKYHKLDKEEFFNARGATVKSCYNEMKLKDMLFAYNSTPCSNAGHTTRDRNGTCIECNTGAIAFSLRKKQVGYIYLACSLKKEFTKVGMTTEKISNRLSKLNSRQVGNTNDWVIISSIKCAKANNIELLVHNELEKYQVRGELYGDTESKEIFRCSYRECSMNCVNQLFNSITKVVI